MAVRKRKIKPAFKLAIEKQEPEEDLKAVKARLIKELEEKEEDKRKWLDIELDKNLKNQ
jgi:hypothetical protein